MENNHKNDKYLTWMKNSFESRKLYAPFIIEMDNEYKDDLSERYVHLLEQAESLGADSESISIIKRYKEKIIEALECYYGADLEKAYSVVYDLVEEVGSDKMAVSSPDASYAFSCGRDCELQFFRARVGDPSKSFSIEDMLHLPNSNRAKAGNYRFSIPGNPCYYLSNSSYGCWIETGFLPDHMFNVSPVLLDGSQKIFNLAVSTTDYSRQNEFGNISVHTWLKLFMLMIATSYRINEKGRTFKSEYIISQAIMIACRKMGYSGVAYYSKRVTSETFARCAINLALVVDYEDEYSEILNHIKIDNPFNYSIYKKLGLSIKAQCDMYELRSTMSGQITNIGDCNRNYSYSETDFYRYDQFLFYTWSNKTNGKNKDQIPWGVKLD